MGFHISKCAANGTRIALADVELSPRPVDVEYPTESLGTLREVPDGTPVQQYPAWDGRVRHWVWRGYPGWMFKYQELWTALEPLLSRSRADLAASPYVYLKDDVTGQLQYLLSDHGTATGTQSGTTLQDSSKTWGTNAWATGLVELLDGTGAGQVRAVSSNTDKVLTVPAWDTSPVAASTTYGVRLWVADWLKCRVVACTRKVASGGGYVRYEETRLSFVIEDSRWNAVG